MDRETFVEAFGDIYETSPWVAEETYSERPFSSLEELQSSLELCVREAPREKTMELLRAHPDLGEKTEMTEASQKEQASAGLDQLSRSQYEAFQELNERYREKFGFPFIMAVKGESPDAIRARMEERVEHSKPTEFETALTEVHKIARLRLEERFASR